MIHLRFTRKPLAALLSAVLAMQSLPCIPLPAAAADAKRFDQSVTVEEIRSMRSFLHADAAQVKIPMDASFDVNGDGCVDVFDMALLKRNFTAQQETTGDFYRLSSELVQERRAQRCDHHGR